jgi:hypothetical protein
MELKLKSAEWIDEERRKYKGRNKQIIDLLDYMEELLENNTNTNNNNNNNNNNNANKNTNKSTTKSINLANEDNEEILYELADILEKAGSKDDDEFFQFVIKHKLVPDVQNTQISYGNNDSMTILRYAYNGDKCKVARVLFDELSSSEKEKFIASIKYNINNTNNKTNFILSNKCFSMITRPYLKNIQPAVALKVLKESQMPQNIINYIFAPVLNVKKTKVRRVGASQRNKTRKNRN